MYIEWIWKVDIPSLEIGKFLGHNLTQIDAQMGDDFVGQIGMWRARKDLNIGHDDQFCWLFGFGIIVMMIIRVHWWLYGINTGQLEWLECCPAKDCVSQVSVTRNWFSMKLFGRLVRSSTKVNWSEMSEKLGRALVLVINFLHPCCAHVRAPANLMCSSVNPFFAYLPQFYGLVWSIGQPARWIRLISLVNMPLCRELCWTGHKLTKLQTWNAKNK